MTTREEALAFGLSYPDTCQDAPFHDPNWQLVRIKSSKKVFLWTYEKDGYINLSTVNFQFCGNTKASAQAVVSYRG